MNKITEINRGFQFIDTRIKYREKAIISKSDINITRRELLYLVIVYDNQGKTLSEILSESGVTKATLSNQIKVLVNKGFVKTKVDLNDSRKKILSITEEGKRAYELHANIRKQIVLEYKNILTDKEVDQLLIIGRKIIAKIKGW